MIEAIEYRKQRDPIVTETLVRLYRDSKHEKVRSILFAALGRPSVLSEAKPHDPVYWLFADIAEYFSNYNIPPTELFLDQIIRPISQDLKAATGEPLNARDLFEQIPNQGTLPQKWIDDGMDNTDVNPPHRRSILDIGDARFYAYPIIRAVLEENQEWFTVAQLKQKCVIAQFPPHFTALRLIVRDAYRYFHEVQAFEADPRFASLKPRVNFFGEDPYAVINGYLAPNLWPPHQRGDMLEIRRALVEIKKNLLFDTEIKPGKLPLDFIFDPDEGPDFAHFIETFLESTKDQNPPATLRLIVNNALK